MVLVLVLMVAVPTPFSTKHKFWLTPLKLKGLTLCHPVSPLCWSLAGGGEVTWNVPASPLITLFMHQILLYMSSPSRVGS